MKKIARLFFILIAMVMLCDPAAAEPRWQVDKAKSKIEFTATYNGDPVPGFFGSFYADIVFDPNNLDASAITVKIPVASVQTNYDERDATVQMPPWFNSQSYPEAVYTSQKITKTGDRTYHADGKLAIKGIERSFGFDFRFTEWNEDAAKKIITAVMQADFTVLRSDFKIGEGEWANDKIIGNAIKVHLNIAAQKSE